ncbi:MAG: hypothetical protein Q7T86_13190 [Hyphomicrobiaceae bacterium]|nr:hypothetical protein [Hyphomicrobiaceae bacterium]
MGAPAGTAVAVAVAVALLAGSRRQRMNSRTYSKLLTEVVTLMPADISLSRALIKLCLYQSICDTDGSDSQESGARRFEWRMQSEINSKRVSINVSSQC